MRTSTFCVLLAATLMMLGGIAVGWMKNTGRQEVDYEAVAALPAEKKESDLMLPVSGEVREAFGARFIEEYGYWCLREYMTMDAEAGELVRAPADCAVRSIVQTDGGSKVILTAEEWMISIWPVSGVRVFKGSALKQGAVIGGTGGEVSVKMEKAGIPVDPEKWLRSMKVQTDNSPISGR